MNKELIRKTRSLYLLLIIPALSIFIFSYLPMYGIVIAFKDYKVAKGIWASPWNNFEYFKTLVTDFYFKRALINTIRLFVLGMIFSWTPPIIFALLLNEITARRFKRIAQTISYLPHFISWVVLGGIFRVLLNPTDGQITHLVAYITGKNIDILTTPVGFLATIVVTGIWQGLGWGSIIYLAAISSVDPGLYDSARIDGANRLQMALKITIPTIMPAIVILFILSLGGVLSGNFDQVFNLYNPLVYNVADNLSTYIYRSGLVEGGYGAAAAVGLFQTVFGVIFIFLANAGIRKFSDYSVI